MKKYLAVSAVAFLVLLPLIVLAQLPIPTVPAVGGTSLPEIENLIRKVGQFLLVIGVIFGLIYIIVGGISWMRAGGEPVKIETAKTRIWSGVWGALVVIAVGLILQTLARVVTQTFFG